MYYLSLIVNGMKHGTIPPLTSLSSNYYNHINRKKQIHDFISAAASNSHNAYKHRAHQMLGIIPKSWNSIW